MRSFMAIRPVILMFGASLLVAGCAIQTPLPVLVRNAQSASETAQQNAAAAMAAAQKAQATADAAAQSAQEAQAAAQAAQAKIDALTAEHPKGHHRHHHHHKAKHNAK